MVVNNCKNIKNYVRALKNKFWRMGAGAIIALNIYK